jgi:hypothetical protein
VTDVGVFGVEEISFSFPWQIFVGATDRKTVVSDAYDLFVAIDDAGSDLCAWIFASLCGKESNAHKIIISSDIVCSFADLGGHGYK